MNQNFIKVNQNQLDVDIDLRYASKNNFTGNKIYFSESCFIHKVAFSNMYTNFIYHKNFMIILEKILKHKGVINVGGPGQSVYNFAVKDNPKIKKIKILNKNEINLPLNSLMSLNKLRKLLKKK